MSIRKAGQVIAGTPNITTGHHVGEIFWTSRLDNELNGAVDADGATYSVAAFTGEHSVPALLRKGRLPYVSMAEYESIVSANGSCRAWGWDNGDTFRVPLLKDVYLMAGQAESAGEFINESLPNIAGGFGAYYNGNANGAFKLDESTNINLYPSGSGGGNRDQYSFDASRSSSAYQDGAKVRPDSVRYRAMVQLSTGVKEDATQLKEYKFNNSHFFGQSMWTDIDPKNGSWLVSNGNFHSGATYGDFYKWLLKIYNKTETVEGISVKGVSDEYTDYDFVINQNDQTFRLPLLDGSEDLPGDRIDTLTYVSGQIYTAPANGWFTAGGPGSSFYSMSFDGNRSLMIPTGTLGYARGFGFVKRGETFVIDPAGEVTPDGFHFVYATGNGSLYFYVGDTIQDPALINAGGVLSDIADSIKRSSATDRETVVGWGMPDYSAVISVSSGYVATKNGWGFGTVFSDWGSGSGYLYVNGVEVGSNVHTSGGSGKGHNNTYMFPISKGEKLTASGSFSNLRFAPCKGV